MPMSDEIIQQLGKMNAEIERLRYQSHLKDRKIARRDAKIDRLYRRLRHQMVGKR